MDYRAICGTCNNWSYTGYCATAKDRTDALDTCKHYDRHDDEVSVHDTDTTEVSITFIRDALSGGAFRLARYDKTSGKRVEMEGIDLNQFLFQKIEKILHGRL